MKIKFTYEDRKELQRVLLKGYNLKRLAQITGTTNHFITKEVILGTTKENYKNRLYGTYEPERVIYNILKKEVEDIEIDAFVEWYKEKKKRNEL